MAINEPVEIPSSKHIDSFTYTYNSQGYPTIILEAVDSVNTGNVASIGYECGE
jgi:hypothetical protein